MDTSMSLTSSDNENIKNESHSSSPISQTSSSPISHTKKQRTSLLRIKTKSLRDLYQYDKSNQFIEYFTKMLLSSFEDKQKAFINIFVLFDEPKENIYDHIIKVFLDFQKIKKGVMGYLENIANFLYLVCSSKMFKISNSQRMHIKEFANKNKNKKDFKKINTKLNKCIYYIIDNDNKNKNEDEKISSTEPCSMFIKIDSMNFMNVLPVNMALQITCEMSKYFRVITPHDLLKSKDSDNINNMTKYFNKISYLIPTEILNNRDEEMQIKYVQYFISVGKELFNLQNFHGLMAIIAGLKNKAITRLHNLLDNDNIFGIEQLNNLMEFSCNFKNYRNHIKNLPEKCSIIPFFGIIITDILHACEQPLFNEDKSVDEKFISSLNLIISVMTNAQSKLVPIQNNIAISKYIENCNVLDDDELWNKSTELLCDNNKFDSKLLPPLLSRRRMTLTFFQKKDDDFKNSQEKKKHKRSSSMEGTSVSFNTTVEVDRCSKKYSDYEQIKSKQGRTHMTRKNSERLTTNSEKSPRKINGRHNLKKSKHIPSLDLSNCTINNDNDPKNSGSVRNYHTINSVRKSKSSNIFQYIEWSISKTCEWVASIGFSKYIDVFMTHNISGRVLSDLTHENLKSEMEIISFGDRIILIEEINFLMGNIKNLDKYSFHDWTIEQVSMWLSNIGLNNLTSNFTLHNIAGRVLPYLTQENLKSDVSVDSFGIRRILMQELEVLQLNI
jgi:hypothetical protein